jgi:hypothetical protein
MLLVQGRSDEALERVDPKADPLGVSISASDHDFVLDGKTIGSSR